MELRISLSKNDWGALIHFRKKQSYSLVQIIK